MPARFLQIHSLSAYPAALLNRDDVGMAKRVPFGGAVRTRISSQCLKRHWRTFEGEGSLDSLDVPATFRSRYTFERHVVAPLVAEGLSDEIVRAAAGKLVEKALGESQKAKTKKKEEGESLKTSQVTVLGEPEVRYFRKLVKEAAEGAADAAAAAKAVEETLKDKETKKNLLGLKHAAGLSAALFGRMVTSDMLARGDAAIHVAHAFTVHAHESETDYFSAIDDLVAEDGELGSGHINQTELTSGLYYSYVVVDVPLLVSNLTGTPASAFGDQDRELASEIVARLIQLIATVSPGAKLGSTAPHAYAQAVLVEAGDYQPRSLANAFLRPVGKGDVLENTYQALRKHVQELDAMYPWPTDRVVAGLHLEDGFRDAVRATAGVRSLPDVAAWAKGKVLA